MAEDPVESAKKLYRDTFSEDPTVGAQAPGRVNLIGEHTDYCDGFVFPMALQRTTVMVGRPNGTSKCKIVTASKQGDETLVAEFDVANDTLVKGQPIWANYVKGTMKQLPQLPGFNAAIATSVPIGGGLSSSAALEVATHTFCDALLTGKSPNTKEKALACQKAEHTFADMPCGIMDQYISTFGEENKALLIDCRVGDLQSRLVPIASDDVVVFIANSNVTHKLSDSEYPKRKASCQAAMKAIAAKFPDVRSLRDANQEQLDAVKSEIDNETFIRARHVIGECDRCLAAEKAFVSSDFAKFGELMVASHVSLRDDYEVSCPELNTLQELAMSVDGVYGSRMTGGGFGGCTVTLAKASCKDKLLEVIMAGYPKAACFFTKPGNGATVLSM